MTLQEIQAIYAKEEGFESWDALSKFSAQHIQFHTDEVAVVYAKQKTLEQREICANNAGIKILWCAHIMQKFPELNTNINRIIAPESILNAHEPEYN